MYCSNKLCGHCKNIKLHCRLLFFCLDCQKRTNNILCNNILLKIFPIKAHNFLSVQTSDALRYLNKKNLAKKVNIFLKHCFDSVSYVGKVYFFAYNIGNFNVSCVHSSV